MCHLLAPGLVVAAGVVGAHDPSVFSRDVLELEVGVALLEGQALAMSSSDSNESDLAGGTNTIASSYPFSLVRQD